MFQNVLREVVSLLFKRDTKRFGPLGHLERLPSVSGSHVAVRGNQPHLDLRLKRSRIAQQTTIPSTTSER
jgi:hypothetical protein